MISFFVPGVPVTKGSAKSFYNPKAKRIVTMQDNAARQKPWVSMISFCAQEAGCRITDKPILIGMVFDMPRPRGHYGTGRNAEKLKPSAPYWHTSVGDIDKLVRCVLDSLTGIAYHDDRQVCQLKAQKIYAESPGVWIKIAIMDEQEDNEPCDP